MSNLLRKILLRPLSYDVTDRQTDRLTPQTYNITDLPASGVKKLK